MKRFGKKKTRRRAVAPKVARSGKTAAGDQRLREQLAKFLDGGEAHAEWHRVFAEMPYDLQGAKPQGAPHTAWQLLEHLRIAQWDILEFSRNPKHVSPQFPDGYWPPTVAPPSAEAWNKSVKAFGHDLDQMKRLVTNPRTNLSERIAHGDGQTILREALLAADHNAYHLGQIVLVRKLLGAWQGS